MERGRDTANSQGQKQKTAKELTQNQSAEDWRDIGKSFSRLPGVWLALGISDTDSTMEKEDAETKGPSQMK